LPNKREADSAETSDPASHRRRERASSVWDPPWWIDGRRYLYRTAASC